MRRGTKDDLLDLYHKVMKEGSFNKGEAVLSFGWGLSKINFLFKAIPECYANIRLEGRTLVLAQKGPTG